MEFDTGQNLHNGRAGQSDIPNGVSGFLAWLMLWLKLCVERPYYRTGKSSGQALARAYTPNRFWRRLWRNGQINIAPVHDTRPFYIFTCSGKHLGTRLRLSPTQFMERLVQLSLCGRVSIYRMRYWRKTVKGKAAPLGTEHEYWRDPLGRIGGRMGRLPHGVWAAHLWPGWQLSYSNLHVSTPEKTFRVDNGVCARTKHPYS